MPRRKVALSDQPRVPVEDPGRKVLRLANGFGIGGAAQGAADLFCDGQQSVPDYRKRDRVYRFIIAFLRVTHNHFPLISITKWPRGLIVALSPGSTTVVESVSSISVGPSTVSPTTNPVRSSTWTSV